MTPLFLSPFVPRLLSLVLLAVLLSGCAGAKGPAAPSPRASQPVSNGGYYKVGQPYQIKGEWYYPKEDYSYDETGIASWYGDDFHDLRTANGETYNKNELTAAHKTLPLPSLARVTNLENGRSIVVRVNDRGPFSGARIIDVSQRSSQLLGFERAGTAKVRVQVLADESKAIADAMRLYGGPSSTSETIIAQAQTPVSTPAVQTAELSPPPPPVPALPQSVKNVRPVAEYVQLPVSGANRIYIQAGAFTKPDNAQRLRQSLTKVGHITVSEAMVKGVQFYRVRLGPIDSVADADKMLKRVVQAGAESARIIVD